MLYNLLIFLPMAACLFWMVLIRIMAFDTHAYRALITLLVTLTLYLCSRLTATSSSVRLSKRTASPVQLV